MSRNLDHLLTRLASVLSEIELIQTTAERRVGELTADARELELLIGVLKGTVVTSAAPSLDAPIPPSDGKRTIQDMAVELIAEAESGLTALEILDLINTRFRADVKRTSLSPQLSRLKADNVIELRGKRWFIARPQLEPNNDVEARELLFAPRHASITEPEDDATDLVKFGDEEATDPDYTTVRIGVRH